MTWDSRFALSDGAKILALMVCVAVQCWLSVSLKDSANEVSVPRTEEATHWDSGLFKSVTFGNLPVAIDSTWIQILTDTHLDHVSKGMHPKVYYDFDLLSDLDPSNFDTFTVGAELIGVVRGDGEGALSVLLKGDRFRKHGLPDYPDFFKNSYWRHSWRIPLLLGYLGLFELKDLPFAAIYFKEAATIPGAPEYLQSMSQRLANPGGEYEVGLKVLNFMISAARSDEEKLELVRKRKSLFIGQFIFELNRSFQDFMKGAPPFRSAARARVATRADLKTFLRENRMTEIDPWGGKLSVDSTGRIVSSTPHDRVFNLD